MVDPVGPPAMISCQPRQARKGATVAVTSCAGVWLAGFASNPELILSLPLRRPGKHYTTFYRCHLMTGASVYVFTLNVDR